MHNEFSEKIWKAIKTEISKHRDSSPQKLCAAFDADGTLWDTDLGELVFEYQIKSKLYSLPENPWQHYREQKKTNTKAAYLWLAQVLQGTPIETLRERNQDIYQEITKGLGKIPTFYSQHKLIDLLHENEIEVYIVTASVQWSIEEGAKLYNIDKDHVIGVKTRIENQIITDTQDGPITYREGKALALVERAQGASPILCAGNTMGDLELLKNSQGISLAVTASPSTSELYETEQELQKEALERAWLSHRF